jgi:hypothetical protein
MKRANRVTSLRLPHPPPAHALASLPRKGLRKRVVQVGQRAALLLLLTCGHRHHTCTIHHTRRISIEERSPALKGYPHPRVSCARLHARIEGKGSHTPQ